MPNRTPSRRGFLGAAAAVAMGSVLSVDIMEGGWFDGGAPLEGPLIGHDVIPFSRAHSQWDRVRHEKLVVDCPCEPGFINQLVNHRITYTSDRPGDVWTLPAITWHQRAGDCEDYVLVKRALWLHNGGSEDDTLFVIVRDLVSHVWHAILLVNYGGRWLSLDNGTDRLLSDDRLVPFYRPFMAMSGDRTWLFVKRP